MVENSQSSNLSAIPEAHAESEYTRATLDGTGRVTEDLTPEQAIQIRFSQTSLVDKQDIEVPEVNRNYWEDCVQIITPVKGAPNVKIGVLGNTDVGKSSLSIKFTKRENIDGRSKVKTTGIDQFHSYLKVDMASCVRRELEQTHELKEDE